MSSILDIEGNQVDNPQEVLAAAKEVGRKVHDTGISYPETAQHILDWINLGEGNNRTYNADNINKGLEECITWENFCIFSP